MGNCSNTCSSGLTCCPTGGQCYNANENICCGFILCPKDYTCNNANTLSPYCTSTSTTSLSAGAIAGIIIAIVFLCCCLSFGVFLCFYGGMKLLQPRVDQVPPSQQPPIIYVQAQGVSAVDVNAKMDPHAPNM